MFKHLALCLVTFAMVSCASSGPKSASKLTVKDFFKNPEISTVKVSPDGKMIAARRPYKKRMNIFVTPFGEKKWKRVTSFSDRSPNLIGWKGNDTLLFMKDAGGDENFHIFSINLTTKEVKDLTPAEGAKTAVVDMLIDVSKTDILVSSNKRLKTVSDVYKVNVISGEQTMVLENPGNYTGWVTDHNGVVRIAIATDGVNNTYFYRSGENKKFSRKVTLNFKKNLSPMFFDAKNKYVYALTNVGTDKLDVVKINPKSFKRIKTIYKNKNYDASGLIWSRKFQKPVAAEYIDWKYQREIYLPYYKEIITGLERYFKNKEVYLVSSNKDEDLFIVYVGSDRTRGMYYTFDVKKDKLNFLADPSPWLDESQMAQVKPIRYKTRDGLTVEGYLTMPVGKGENVPLVVNPHGGPWHRDVWGYNPEVQFLASRGFAVLQMNFRGSTGYGRKFWQASFKEWGKKMQNDITDGVKWTIEKGMVDKDNVCIYGASYGGYATLAGLTFTPNLYKCGVDYVGVSNLFTFQETIPDYWKPYKKMLHEMVGHPEKDKALLESASPFFHADKISAALFVAQGANDPRVKKSESDQIVQALKARGVEVEYMVKDNEGHGFHNEENRFEFYEKMEDFLKENIKSE